MNKKYTKEDIIEALKQAEANMDFEEVIISNLENDNNKVLRKDLNNERKRRYN